MNVVVIGTGYVGLVTGLGYAKLGHRVACVDTDAGKIAKLDRGEAPFFEPGLSELLRETQEAGRIVFTTDLPLVIGDAEILVLAVGTPMDGEGSADLSFLISAADSVGTHLDHEAIVVVKSTVPPGTNRRVLARVREAMGRVGRDHLSSLVQIASLPEFLREGKALEDFFSPARIVIGAQDDVVHTVIGRLHEGLQSPRHHMGVESAELTKYAANAFLATKISFVNEIANLAERTGADVRDVARAVGADPRIGSAFLQPGLGYGGSCFPKDVSALAWLSGTSGYDFKLLSAVIEVNNRQRDRFFRMIESELAPLKGRRVAVWGLAFKGGTDDVRESAALDLVQRLCARGADVCAYDPRGMGNAQRLLPESVQFAQTAVDATEGAEALLVLTDWNEFRDVSFDAVHAAMIEPKIYDGRNLLADLGLEGKGFVYRGVGLGKPIDDRR
jgi:UDPglucose 6-dehydrogenase